MRTHDRADDRRAARSGFRDGSCPFRGDASDRDDRDGDGLDHAPEAFQADDFSSATVSGPCSATWGEALAAGERGGVGALELAARLSYID